MGLFKEHPLSHYHKAFRRYLTVKSRMDDFASCRDNGCHGIAIGTDPMAKAWQRTRYRREVLYSFLRGEAFPNPFYASWLSNQEARMIWIDCESRIEPKNKEAHHVQTK